MHDQMEFWGSHLQLEVGGVGDRMGQRSLLLLLLAWLALVLLLRRPLLLLLLRPHVLRRRS